MLIGKNNIEHLIYFITYVCAYTEKKLNSKQPSVIMYPSFLGVPLLAIHYVELIQMSDQMS